MVSDGGSACHHAPYSTEASPIQRPIASVVSHTRCVQGSFQLRPGIEDQIHASTLEAHDGPLADGPEGSGLRLD